MKHFLPSYHRHYVNRWRCIVVFWALLAICSAILQFATLVDPQWIVAENGIYFGLYNHCATTICQWRIFTVKIISNISSIAALFMLIATIFSLLSAFSIILLVLMRDRYVLLLCAWMHMLSSLMTLFACLIYPYGWNDVKFHEVCESESYDAGVCEIGSAFLLALVLVIDHFCMSMFGFVLACKQPPSTSEVYSISAYSTNQRKKLSRDQSHRTSLYSNGSLRLAI
uniref:Lipoma HMGIC fusion partner-like 4 protein n=1 Tax=Ascaris suum TaxID=6253 RepID=F1LC85_ASCSU